MTSERNRVDEPNGQTGTGPLRRADDALTRRGFTTRRLRLRAAAVIVVIAAGVSGVLLYKLTNVLGPDTVCGGAATADQLHAALGPGRISEERSDGYAPGAYDRAATCVAKVSSGLFGASERTASFALQVNPDEIAPPTAPDARLFAGGSAGAALPSRAWAVLPEGCPRGMRAEVGLGGDTADGDRGQGLAELAVAYADTAAKAKGCGTGKLPAPTVLSAAAAPQPVDFGKVCGLPGLAPTRAPGADGGGYRQQATAAFAPVWSCEIGYPTGGSPLVSFAIATDPRVTGLDPKDARTAAYGRAQWIGASGHNVVADCQGRPTYFHLDWRGGTGVGDRGVFTDGNELWRQFLTAGGKAVGCEPIVP
ncbi:hypothetical protein RMN57_10580 [Kitasatospora sp. CM 4170]|uniref:Uncharacterized protein n=1 Tax=Kitasatospora aburaviensis TaxID=67265 RepID=A0ABW1EW65_9ACTN|nr:hypothetical protein [Kitasatospora sp. CM 4170]WNM45129.1 hypothetical protein RMN57_10580 [Kitasatospora sp. CM 4170]